MRFGKPNTTFKRERKNPLTSSSSQHLNENGATSASVRDAVYTKFVSDNDKWGRWVDRSSPGWSGGIVCGVGARGAPWPCCVERRPFGHNLHHPCKCFHLAVLPRFNLLWFDQTPFFFFTLKWIPFCFTVTSECVLGGQNGTFLHYTIALYVTAYDSPVSLYAFHLVFLAQLVSTHCPTRTSNISFLFVFNFREHLKKWFWKLCFFPHLSLDTAEFERGIEMPTALRNNCVSINNIKT